MRSWLVLMLFMANLGFLQPQPTVQSQVAFSDLAYTYRFGQDITFEATISQPDSVKDIFLFLQPEGDATRTEKVTADTTGSITFKYDLTQKPLRPFANINFWFRAVDPQSNITQSDKQSFLYEDNRFTWQKLDEGSFQVRWINGDLSFGQAILNAAQQGLKTTGSLLNVSVPNPLRIYVYTNSTDLQNALSLSQKTWVAGLASPDLGAILVSIAPGPDQQVELERQIPHELMHIRIYQVANGGYKNLPTWFNEGLASLAELTPNPDFQSALNSAVENHSLLSFSTICAGFPGDASGAFLAYAQSVSFVRFLHQKYGSTAFQKLISNYSNGLGCMEGVNAALGISLEQLEVRWQQEILGMNTGQLALDNLSPYLISGLLILFLPLGFGLIVRKKPKQPAPGVEVNK